MQGQSYLAHPASRAAIRSYAKQLRKALHLETAEYIDIIYLAENVFPRLFERYHYSFEIMDDEEMQGCEGLTDPISGRILISNSVYEGACMGNGRDRLTIAHEIGHFLLHDDVVVGFARSGEQQDIPAYRNPEWQASAFAAEFLMDHDVIRKMSVDEIVEKCKVSRQAAYYQKGK